MATPKEKAEELVNKYLEVDLDLSDSYYGKISLGYGGAKNCALIAVNEICYYIAEIGCMNSTIKAYWQEVKNELQKM